MIQFHSFLPNYKMWQDTFERKMLAMCDLRMHAPAQSENLSFSHLACAKGSLQRDRFNEKPSLFARPHASKPFLQKLSYLLPTYQATSYVLVYESTFNLYSLYRQDVKCWLIIILGTNFHSRSKYVVNELWSSLLLDRVTWLVRVFGLFNWKLLTSYWLGLCFRIRDNECSKQQSISWHHHTITFT